MHDASRYIRYIEGRKDGNAHFAPETIKSNHAGAALHASEVEVDSERLDGLHIHDHTVLCFTNNKNIIHTG